MVRKSAPVAKKQVMPQDDRIEDAEDVHIGGGFQNEQEIHDALPIFLKPENLMDINKNKFGSPNYDPTTLYIPPAAWKDFTPGMYQYWEMKQRHFDKIFFFKLGKFYEIFFNDAIIC